MGVQEDGREFFLPLRFFSHHFFSGQGGEKEEEGKKRGGGTLLPRPLTQILIVLSAAPEANHSFETGSTARERTQPRCPETTR